MNKEHDKFWYDDIKILFNTQRLTEFFPNKNMNMDEKLMYTFFYLFRVSIICI